MTEKNFTNPNGAIRPVQIIPSVLPADWANMGACVKNLEMLGSIGFSLMLWMVISYRISHLVPK